MPTGAPQRDLATLTGRAQIPATVRAKGGMAQLNWVLSLEHPEEFVAALATEELYLLMADIGAQDAYVLMEYATDEQLGGLVDLDAWVGERVELPRWVAWVDRALEVSHDTALRFIRATEPELIELLVTKDVQVHPHDLDLDEVPDELAAFQTPDGAFWVTLPRGHELEARLPELMKLMWAADGGAMRDIFQASRFELPSPLEETLRHFRSGRLQDMGFPPPSEAGEVFKVLDARALRQQVRQDLDALTTAPPLGLGAVAGDLALRGATPPTLLAEALERLDDEARANFGQAMTYLVNKVFMAQTGDLSRTDELPDAARLATGLVNLGLAYVADEDPERAAEVLRRLWPETLMRAGNSLTVTLALRARRLRARAGARDGLRVFGEPTDSALEAVAAPRPMFYEGLLPDQPPTWRPFATTAELARVEATIANADAVLSFFERTLGFSPSHLESDALAGLDDDDRANIRLGTLLRTGLAHALLTDELSFQPLAADDLGAFLQVAFEDGALSPALQRAVDGLTEHLDPPVARWVEREMDALTEALGRVKAYDLDPKYARELFLVRPGR